MENSPFIDDFPSELHLHLFQGYSMAMLNFRKNHIKPHSSTTSRTLRVRDLVDFQQG